jgi:acetyltransferase
VGSTSAGKLGYVLIKQMLEGGFRPVYAVNPKASSLFLPGVDGEVPGFDAVSKIPAVVDLAVIASPAATVASVLEDCGRAGVKVAVVISAGFSEVGNAAGEEELKRITAAHGIRIVGPNCAGILNTAHNLYATLEVRPPAGQTAFISQSGALGGAVLAWAEEQGLGISKFVSYGNRADLDEVELLPYLAEDPETRVVALYIESVRDGRAFMRVVDEFTRRKPLVVIKAGRSRAGQRATLSHTGSMAGADAVYEAALRQCGALRVDTVEEMFDLCKGFVSVPPVRGRRIAIVTNSGGPGVMAADWDEKLGVEVGEPSPRLRETLAALRSVPAHCSLKNPFDLTVEGTEEGYQRTLEAVLEEYDAALALNVNPPYLDPVPLARGVCAAAQSTGKPVVATFMAGSTVAAALPLLKAHGIPNYPTGERAVAVLARMAEYYARRRAHDERRSLHARTDSPESAPGPGRRTDQDCQSYPAANFYARTDSPESARGPGRRTDQDCQSYPAARPVLEPEAMAWLRENGIPVPEFRLAHTAAEAVQGCRELGYPAVMKVVSPDILHKTDAGGVILDIRDDDMARAAFVAVQRAAAGADFRGAVIYPMIRGAQEVLLGLARDPQFGPVVMFGLGGIYTEVLRDISLRVAPIDRAEAEAMIGEIRAAPLLREVRGQRPCDLDALADVLVRFSRLPFRWPELREVDLNPVFLFPQGLVVGDVRVIAG